MPRPILVSACLLGLNTRYDGTARQNQRVLTFLRDKGFLPIPVCPEQLAGLPTPRPPVRFTRGGGDAVLDGEGEVATEDGRTLNAAFLNGAAATLQIARLTGCGDALLKERSPSCGVHQVVLGEGTVAGRGVTAALLARNGLRLRSEEDL